MAEEFFQFFYPQITQMDTDKGTSAGWNLWSFVTSVDDNGFCDFGFETTNGR